MEEEAADPQKCGIHHWAEHGIVGRGILIDYWTYANENGIVYGEDLKCPSFQKCRS